MPRADIAMSLSEIESFLDEARTLVLAVPGTDVPHLTAMWFVRRGHDLALWTYGPSQKVLSLRRRPRATVLVEEGSEYDMLRGVAIECDVEIVDDADQVVAVGADLAARYDSIIPATDDEEKRRAHLKRIGRLRVGLLLHPTRYRSWDHRKVSTNGNSAVSRRRR